MPDVAELQRRVDAALEGRARQVIEAHGGGVLITAGTGGHVDVHFKGRCAACPSAAVTMGSLVEPIIRQVEGVTSVSRPGRISIHAQRRIAAMFGLDEPTAPDGATCVPTDLPDPSFPTETR